MVTQQKPLNAGAAEARRTNMTTATLSGSPATQLTFPWVQGEEDGAIVAESKLVPSTAVEFTNVPPQAAVMAVTAPPAEVADSLSDALVGNRIGRPFKMGSVMFRLLKSYGITDEEIAAGVAAYNARKNASK